MVGKARGSDSSSSSGSSGGSPGCVPDVCPGGQCPIALAVGQNPSGVIAVDASYVYWTSSHDGTVMRASIRGIIAATGGVTALAAAPPNVLLAYGESSIVELPSGGGSSTPVRAPGPPYVYGGGEIAVDATYPYASGSQAIVKTPLAGGPTTTLVSNQNGIAHMSIDATNVYWTVTNDGTVNETRLDGTTGPIAVATLQSYPTGVAVDATNVYWTNHAGASSCTGGAVMKVPIAGGAPVALATNQPAADGIAVDAANVYWTLGSTDADVANGAVMKVTK